MPMEVNAVRGEVAAKVGNVSIVMAATMEDVAKLSNALGNPTFVELARRLIGVEVVAVMAALRLFTVRGEADGESLDRRKAGEAAAKAYRLADNEALAEAFAKVLEPLLKPVGDGGDTSKNG